MHSNSSFQGKQVVLTGKLSSMTRKEAETKLRQLGATSHTSVNQQTSLVIVGEKAGAKKKKAEELGIETINEKVFLQMLAKENQPPSSFEGKRVVLTGSLSLMTRKEAEQKIRELGGSPSTSVSKNTNLLIVGEKAGAKKKKAEELGIQIVEEFAFYRLLHQKAQISEEALHQLEEHLFSTSRTEQQWAQLMETQQGEPEFFQDMLHFAYHLGDDGATNTAECHIEDYFFNSGLNIKDQKVFEEHITQAVETGEDTEWFYIARTKIRQQLHSLEPHQQVFFPEEKELFRVLKGAFLFGFYLNPKLPSEP